MKEVKLVSLRLENFKGIRELNLSLGDSVTEIRGRNATGKTTIYDAITWLLFGKDSFDRKSFEIKTRDANGDVIADIPHVVEGVLSVDGVDVTLRREYCEDWRKRRGTMTREMCGHVECRYYNGVPCNAREYSEKINAICPERWFKLLSIPTYFNAMRPDERRAMLMEMAGEDCVEDVIGDNADFRMLVREMQGKTIEEYNRELAARKKKLKASLVDIPARIDERKKDIEPLLALDFAALRARREDISNKIDASMDCLKDKSKREHARDKERTSLVRNLNKARREAATIEQKAKSAAAAEMRSREEQSIVYADKQRTMETHIASLKSDLSFMDRELADCNTYREQLIGEWKAAAAEAKKPMADGGGGYTCPTCGHVYDAVEYVHYQQTLAEARKAELEKEIMRLHVKCEENDVRIDELTARRRGTDAQLVSEQALLNEYFRKQQELEEQPPVNADALLCATDDFANALNAVKEAEDALAAFDARPVDENEDEAAILALCESIDALDAEKREVDVMISKEAILVAGRERIAEMEKAYKDEAQRMCDVEHMESLLIAFNRRRVEMAEGRINGLFTNTRFRLLERQVNGLDVDICEAEVGGVPYAGLNSAMRTNCGLDIINAISRHLDMSAPTIIDNAEAVNEILPTSGQQIRLYVTNDKQLNIITNN